MSDQRPGKLIAAIHGLHPRALEVLEDVARVETLLLQAGTAAGRSALLQQTLAPLRHLVRSHVRGSYRDADPEDVAWALAAVMYVAAPWDLAPDYLPHGLRDDELVAKWVLERIRGTLVAYVEWERAERKRAAARPSRAD